MILKELNINSSANELEKVTVESISYFEEHSLLDCVKEYAEILAYKFYQEENMKRLVNTFILVAKLEKTFKRRSAKINEKINVLIAGLVILLSLGLTAFTESEQHALNRGDGGGAPARPDYVNIGDTGGAPADNKGDGGGVSQL